MVSILSIKSILSTTLPVPLAALHTARPFRFYKTAQNTPCLLYTSMEERQLEHGHLQYRLGP